jgi:hypothetical protein
LQAAAQVVAELVLDQLVQQLVVLVVVHTQVVEVQEHNHIQAHLQDRQAISVTVLVVQHQVLVALHQRLYLLGFLAAVVAQTLRQQVHKLAVLVVVDLSVVAVLE